MVFSGVNYYAEQNGSAAFFLDEYRSSLRIIMEPLSTRADPRQR
jgi:hypothetical protein